ncbi:piggyBac transposable element-derived protein 4 [Trichonephila clavipes]|nr:piggyBac transposable element-derived protein 4 [Trichonephila clavipes]
MKFLRFDKKTIRSERLQTDKFCFISEVWKKFIENSIICSKPGPYITTDEQLFPSDVKCRFTQYMISKPDKFGFKPWLAADVDSKFVLNNFPYLCKDEERPVNLSLSRCVVLRLIEPFENKARNITMNNFYYTKSVSNVKHEEH